MIQTIALEINPQYAALMMQDSYVLLVLVLLSVLSHCMIHTIHHNRTLQLLMHLPEGHIIGSTTAFTAGVIMGICLTYINLIFPLRQIMFPAPPTN
jgi:hypothetical protein